MSNLKFCSFFLLACLISALSAQSTILPTGYASAANSYAATTQSGLNALTAQQASLLSNSGAIAAEYNSALANNAIFAQSGLGANTLGVSNYGTYQSLMDNNGYATSLTASPMMYESIRTSVSQAAQSLTSSATGFALGGMGAHGYANFNDGGGLISFNPCSGFNAYTCSMTDYCSFRDNKCVYSFSTTVTVGEVVGGSLYGHIANAGDPCADLVYEQCNKMGTCQWDASTAKCRSLSYNLHLDKVFGTLVPGGSPFVPSRFLRSVGSVQTGFGMVGLVDMCNNLLNYYQCREYHGCDWDGIGCISKTIVGDSVRDICSDYLNTQECNKNNCVWYEQRCTRPSSTWTTIPLPHRFRTRFEIMGQGFAPYLHVPLPAIRLTSPDVVAMKNRALEFFKYQFGVDFYGQDEYEGLIINGAKDSDALFYQVISADLPYGAKLIPRRNRIIQEKFIVSAKPGYATTLGGAYAAYLGQYTVRMDPGEVLEYGALHVIDENDNVVFTMDYHYNYPLIPNTVGVVGLNAEVLSSYGFGFMRGASVVLPSYEGFNEVDATLTIILGDGAGSVSTPTANQAAAVAFGGMQSLVGGVAGGVVGGVVGGKSATTGISATGIQASQYNANLYQTAQSGITAQAGPAIGGASYVSYGGYY